MLTNGITPGAAPGRAVHGTDHSGEVGRSFNLCVVAKWSGPGAARTRLGRYPVVARRCLSSYTPRLAELQVGGKKGGGNVGLNVLVGSAATPPFRLFTPV